MATTSTSPMLPEVRQAPLSEKYVLAYLLGYYEDVMNNVITILPAPEYFADPKRHHIYKRMLAMHAAGQFISLETMAPRHDDLYLFADLADLMDTSFTHSDFMPEMHVKERAITNARLVADAYHRQLIANSVDDASITDLASYIETLERLGRAKHLNIHQLAAAALDRLDKKETRLLRYPYPLFNSMLEGIAPGSYTIIGARPSTGKSVMLQDLILHAVREERKVLFLSAEMPQEMLEHRLLCSILGRDLSALKRLWQPDRYAELVVKGATEMDSLTGLDIIFSNRVSDIEERIKKNGYDLVVVDYLQMLEPRRRNWRGDYEKVTAVSAELVAMARAYNTAFIVAAQFNREGNDKQPSMAELKGSGQIEQDADLIFSLWRDEKDHAPLKERMVRVDCLKNRNGSICKNGNKRFALLMEEGIYRFKGILTETA